MIRVNQLKLPVTHSREDLEEKLARTLRVEPGQIRKYRIVRQSIDARKKEDIVYIYAVDVFLSGEERVVHRAKNRNAILEKEVIYRFPEPGTEELKDPPVIIGLGPAGLICGLMLARAGYRPLILERGSDVDSRTKQVAGFWAGEKLDPRSNVQFGEGGAGTFSDGKLNTMVKDVSGRNRKVLEILVEFGADPAILYQGKPHIGTDVLSGIVKAIRREIIRLGGTVAFETQAEDLILEEKRLTGIRAAGRDIPVQAAVLAVGHSARDTFEMLWKRGVPMTSKPFAVGLRIQHPQTLINLSQYGMEDPGILGAASYKLTYQSSFGRGVYSFCMCPGGYVVNASSEPGRLAVNGMSNHARDGVNANSALIVTVTPEDFPDQTPLGGIAYQRRLEELAFCCGEGRIPIQMYGDFRENRPSMELGEVTPQMKGGFRLSNLRQVLPEQLSLSLIEAIDRFGGMIRGFDRYDSLLAGIESRTSSPVRIPRNDRLESEISGLFPCGEGAGYAGGITSAAMDGLKVAEEIARRYRPLQTPEKKG